MASPAPEVPPKAKNHEYRVLVTGFGPFHDLYPINPSFLIASSLPHKIQFQASGQSRPSVPRWDGPFDVDPREINISFLRLPNAIPVSYAAVQDLVPAIYGVSEYDHLDFVIHIGMAGSRDFYTLEQRAHSYGYSKKDVEGRTILDGKVRFRRRTEGLEEWEGGNADLPDVLETDVAVEDVWAKWKKRIPDSDVRISDDAGRYLCEYLYYSSLAHFRFSATAGWRKRGTGRTPGVADRVLGVDTKVVFLHVPGESDQTHLQRGREVVIALVQGLVESQRQVTEADASDMVVGSTT